MLTAASGTSPPFATHGGPRARLSRMTVLLHGLVGLAVLGMIAGGYWLQTLPGGPGKTAIVQTHKSFGLLVFVAALVRIVWRFREGFPPAAGAHRPLECHAALVLHLFLIAATVAMPLSGIGRSLAYARPVNLFGWPVIPQLFDRKNERLYDVCAGLHDWLALIIVGCLVLHVAAALKHHLVDRDESLRRMVGLSAKPEGER